jgi:excisionase family DNA binding protein
MPRKYYSLDEAAELVGTSTRSLRRLISNGQLKAVRIGTDTRLIRIDRDELDKVIHPVTPNGKY